MLQCTKCGHQANDGSSRHQSFALLDMPCPNQPCKGKMKLYCNRCRKTFEPDEITLIETNYDYGNYKQQYWETLCFECAIEWQKIVQERESFQGCGRAMPRPQDPNEIQQRRQERLMQKHQNTKTIFIK